jgi:hypothetical protein
MGAQRIGDGFPTARNRSRWIDIIDPELPIAAKMPRI